LKSSFQRDADGGTEHLRKHLVRLQVVGPKTFGVESFQINRLQTSNEIPFGTVDEFVAAKASEINRLQHVSTSGVFALLNLKDFRDGFLGRAPGPKPDSGVC